MIDKPANSFQFAFELGGLAAAVGNLKEKNIPGTEADLKLIYHVTMYLFSIQDKIEFKKPQGDDDA